MKSTQKSKEKPLPVVFRTFREGGDVIALFPTVLGTSDPYTCTCYQHVGQHGAADPWGCVRDSRPATAAESRGLLRELRSLGYDNLKVLTRIPRNALALRRAELQRFRDASPLEGTF